MRRDLSIVKARKQKLIEKRMDIDIELEELEKRQRELEDEEIIAICRKNCITIEELMEKVRMRKEKNKDEKDSGKDD